ncbi:MAG: aminodeoxychorismate/anthranilate synthase component II [Myxococcales bacterium]|nr:aminodeoxychorismate/anthranilate synthase component II [Myxococcales bacterium]
MILVIDNYDSFTYNLVQYLGELGARVEVFRNDALAVSDVAARDPEGLLLSPGPGMPDDAGITLEALRAYGARYPILGVCLGHQSIAQAFGARVVRAGRLMHGRTSPIEHRGDGVFTGLPSPFTATRYHSLIVDPDTLGDELVKTAWTQQGELMGLRHRELEVEGVQFHPESFLTEHGHRMLDNFLARLPHRGRRAPREIA